MERTSLVSSLVVVTLALAACGGGDGDDTAADAPSATTVAAVADGAPDAGSAPDGERLVVDDPWSREPAEGQSNGVVYATVSNPTDADVTITAAASPVTDDVQLHETTTGDDGSMSMSEVEGGLVVPAGGELALEPGGAHVMLVGIDPATYPSEVEVTLELDEGDPVTFVAEVRPIGSGGDLEAGDDEASEMSHGDGAHDGTDG